jgi:adenine-specific DNA-methyltransferase
MKPEKIERRPSSEHRLEVLRDLFPEVFSDGRVAVDRLRDLLEDSASEAPAGEHYGLTWPGKLHARRRAYQTPQATLRPLVNAGIDEATTHNAVVIGDNLQVLLSLRKSYANAVKLIYIDPPYNTGKDLIYRDDFSDPVEAFLEATQQADVGGLLVSNPKTGGRLHSRWLSMMLPRLALAHSLLSDDGLLAVSIDDNEVHTLRLLLDEQFGEQNFVGQVVWHTEGHTDNQYDLKVTHEYILLYARDAKQAALGAVIDPNTRAESNLWKGYAENSITKNGPANPVSEVLLPIGFPCNAENLDLPATSAPKAFFDAIEKNNRVITRELTSKYDVDYPVRLDPMKVRKGALVAPCRVLSGWANKNKLVAFIKAACKPMPEPEDSTLRFFLSERGVIYYRRERGAARNIVSVWQKQGTTETARADLERLGVKFQYPKPVPLLQYLIRVANVGDGDLVLDFFAGSGTTGEAVLRQNKEDGAKRRFLLIQFPEPLGGGIVAGPGLDTIDKITCERLRRVSKALKAEGVKGDLGFRVFEEDSPALARPLHLSAEQLEKGQLAMFKEKLAHVQATDLFTEVLLLLGYPLDAKREPVPTQGASNTLWRFEHPRVPQPLLLCLDNQVDEDLLDSIRDKKNHTFVCRDESLTDVAKARFYDALKLADSTFMVL